LIIQGPPGTGKTSAILGMVSALLHRNTDSMTPPPSTSTSTSALSGVDAMGGDGGLPENNLTGFSNHTVDGRDGKKQRLLLCAPSNAAVDELLLRLLKGVYNSHGKLVVVKVTSQTIIYCGIIYDNVV
jgi:senataxin